jgi:nucleolin
LKNISDSLGLSLSSSSSSSDSSSDSDSDSDSSTSSSSSSSKSQKQNTTTQLTNVKLPQKPTTSGQLNAENLSDSENETKDRKIETNAEDEFFANLFEKEMEAYNEEMKTVCV